MLNTPVVFLIFRRPDLTAQVFEAIRQAKPTKLLVVADGPRNEDEVVLCQQSREITEQIDWECEVFRNYSDVNLGCRERVASGITWAFEQVEEAIILEDDCLPTFSFFTFCETLIERYRYDERIMMISGDNFQMGNIRNEYSYYFSRYVHIWGWASWRRAWKHYDVEMKTWLQFKEQGFIQSICENRHEQEYWIDIFDQVFSGVINTWDYQWLYASWTQSGLSIIPSYNLVKNIGCGLDATHPSDNSISTNLPTQDIWEISHPSILVRNRIADDYTFRCHYNGQYLKRKKTWRILLHKGLKAVRLISRLK